MSPEPNPVSPAVPAVWYRSLYWRLAIGTLAIVLVLLAVQAAIVIWVVGQSDRAMLSRPPVGLARLVAADLSTALEADPAADPEALLRDAFSRAPQNIAVVFRDGR